MMFYMVPSLRIPNANMLLCPMPICIFIHSADVVYSAGIIPATLFSQGVTLGLAKDLTAQES
jgi:hypothetical protein